MSMTWIWTPFICYILHRITKFKIKIKTHFRERISLKYIFLNVILTQKMDKWIVPNMTDHHQSLVDFRICFDFNVIIISLCSSHSLRIIISFTSHTLFLANWNICNMYLQYDIHSVHVCGIKVTVIQVLWNKKNNLTLLHTMTVPSSWFEVFQIVLSFLLI